MDTQTHESDYHHHHAETPDNKYISAIKWTILVVSFMFALWISIGTVTTGTPGIDLVFSNPEAISTKGYAKVMFNPFWIFSWATLMLFVFAADFLPPIWEAIKSRRMNISLFVGITILASYIYSVVYMGIDYSETVNGQNTYFLTQHSYFDATIEVISILYIGYYLEKVVVAKVKKNLKKISTPFPKYAFIIKGQDKVKILTSELKVGDIVLVEKGGKFPLDGVVHKGYTIVNEASITGENLPKNKHVGDKIYGGTISMGDQILVKVTNLIGDSFLTKIHDSLKLTKDQNMSIVSLTKKLEKWVIRLILAVATGAFIFYFLTAGSDIAFNVFITTIIVACPMSFILLPPMCTLIAFSISAKKGITFNTNNLFEKSKSINTIIFDKTGTLTTGDLKVIKTSISDKYHWIVKELEKTSSHPIATCIYNSIDKKPLGSIKTKEIIGYGVQGKYKNQEIFFGSLKLINTKLPDNKQLKESKTYSVRSHLVIDGQYLGSYELEDQIKKSAFKAISNLQKKQMEIFMFTGDSKVNAIEIGEKLGIKRENIKYELSPFDKLNQLKSLQTKGKKIAFVGDGINDSIVLSKADIGISMNVGSDLAIDSSDITILGKNLDLINTALYITNRTKRAIVTGIVLAFIWIIFALTFSVVAVITPLVAALFMVFNDLFPVFWSFQLFGMRNKNNK